MDWPWTHVHVLDIAYGSCFSDIRPFSAISGSGCIDDKYRMYQPDIFAGNCKTLSLSNIGI